MKTACAGIDEDKFKRGWSGSIPTSPVRKWMGINVHSHAAFYFTEYMAYERATE